MKILIKECKKIMDIRVLLVIAVFTVLFYHLFLEVTIYPAGGQTTDSPYGCISRHASDSFCAAGAGTYAGALLQQQAGGRQ